jgi:hypothetical protein
LKILIFSAFDPIPSDDAEPIRYAWLAEAFLKKGHSVTYISSDFFHISKSYRKSKTWNKNGTSPKNLDLVLLHAPSYQVNTSLKRLWSHTVLGSKFRKFLRSLFKNELPDLVISASPPLLSNYFLTRWSKKNNITHIIDLQDYWPDIFARLVPLKILLFPLKQVLNYSLKSATAVAAMSQDLIDFYRKDINDKPSRVFHLGIRTDLFENIINQQQSKNELNLIYLGTSQDNSAINDFAACFAGIPDLSITLAGKISEIDNATKYSNIKYLPWIPFIKLPELLHNYDIGLLIVNPELKIAFPNKVFVYFAAGLPVISNVRGGELEKFMSENDLGITIPEDTWDAYNQAVAFCKTHYDHEGRKKIREFAKSNFNVLHISEQYMNWGISLVNNRGSVNKT